MDSSEKFDNPSPRLKANIVSKWFFWWLIPLFWYGRRNDLEPKDIYNVLLNETSESLADNLERNWKKELDNGFKNKRKPNFHKAIEKTFWSSFMKIGITIFILTIIIKTLQPLALGLFIQHYSPNATSTTIDAFIYASGVVLITFLESMIFCHTNYQARELGMQLRIACSSLIYRKIMRLSCLSANQASSGFAINLLSNDVTRFDNIFLFLHYIWVTPLQGILIAYFIWRSVGIAALAGVFFLTLQTVPVQIYFGKLIHGLRKKASTRSDQRLLLMSEIINGIRVIKMYTWEPVFQQLIYIARSHEINVIGIVNYLKGTCWAFYVYTQRTALFVAILVYVLQNNIVTSDKVFTVAQYFSILQLSMATLFPRGLHFYAEAKVSINRIQNFLLFEETDTDKKLREKCNKKKYIFMEKVNASWMKDSTTNHLNNISVSIENKNLCVVVGNVGAGKSSFLKLILGEFHPSTGQISVDGKVSYASQEPWLFTGSIKSNIIFGQVFDEDKYNRVTTVCCLIRDFEQLPHGDRTLVGERGAALSGGQCARINLARAVYRDADIYILDDPLSAVDTHVSKRLFENCINGYLKGKTRILVTHQIQFLKDADTIIYLKKGTIEFQGNYENFQKCDKYFEHMDKNELIEKPLTEELVNVNVADDLLDLSNLVENENHEEPKETQELVAKGSASKFLYLKYFQASGSYSLLFLLIIIILLAQLLSSGSDYWIAFWIKIENAQKFTTEKNKNSYKQLINAGSINVVDNYTNTMQTINMESSLYLDRHTALCIYGFLVFGSAIMLTGRNILLYKICNNSSNNIHNKMIDRVLKTPIRFFDINPSGRILNRFSKDLGAVDELFSFALVEYVQVFSVLIGSVVQIIIINWWMIFPIYVMLFLHWTIKNIYIKTAQNLKRLEGNAKSPVLSHANSSITGLLTIRACKAETLVCKEFDNQQDVHTAAYSLVLAATTAFGLWIDLVTVCFAAIVNYSFIIFDNKTISGENVGLAITQVLGLCGVIQHGMKMVAEIMTQIISFERLYQFTKLEQEGPFETEVGKEPPKFWPSKGEIKFDRLYLKYNDDNSDTSEPVLKNLCFDVKSGMKVGIVGRTGAGKSSLTSALFRLAIIDGGLYIDGVDTKRIGLKDLRSKISIIPQEPMLFSASLRENLDPFHEFDDATIWSALQDVELNKAFTSLDQSVDHSGSNFSAGQKQLLCLARAIVKKNKILVLDEATANVDHITDALIQKTIRINFKNCTVLTIAHRLNTIMDSDKVLVMNNGEIEEYDHPYVLLQNNNGFFIKMIEQTGNIMAEYLMKIAEEAYKKKEINIDPENRTKIKELNKA